MKAYLVLTSLLVLGVIPGPGAYAQGVDENAGLASIEAGIYTPLYQTPYDTSGVPVEAFLIDTYPVTNADYLAFVSDNPAWRRSAISPLFADDQYLQHWSADLTLGEQAPEQSPVVNVSWFAAMAYAEWTGKRLPTQSEWEYVAAAGIAQPDGRSEPGHYERIMAWYAEPTPDVVSPIGSSEPNYWGVHDMHGLVWEWVFDFNNALVTGESRNDSDLDLKLFCGSGAIGVSDFKDYAAFMRFAFRSSLDGAYTSPNLGFRTAKDKPLKAEL